MKIKDQNIHIRDDQYITHSLSLSPSFPSFFLRSPGFFAAVAVGFVFPFVYPEKLEFFLVDAVVTTLVLVSGFVTT